MRNSSSLDWLRFMHTPNDYRVSRFISISFYSNSIYKYIIEKLIILILEDKWCKKA